MSVHDEVRVFRTILWPLIKADLLRVKGYYRGFLPPVVLDQFAIRSFRRDLDTL